MKRYNIQWAAKALVNQMKKGNINFDNSVQRGLVWDQSKKSLLIHSMVYGYAIPALYFTKENGVYDSLDGKQRSNAISEFLNDEFLLSLNTPLVYDDDGKEENISGLAFSQLPEWVQDRIKEYSLTIYFYEDMAEHEVKEFFRRLNNGKPLSAIELTRVSTPDLKKFQELARHDAIQSVVSDSGKRRFADENIAMQIYHIATVDAPDFSTKIFRDWAKCVYVDSKIMNGIVSALDTMNDFINELDTTVDKKLIRTIKARTHFVSACYYCYLAIQGGKNTVEIIQCLKSFFSGSPTISAEYNKTVGAGSAKPTAVQTRKKIIKSLINDKGGDL